MPDDVNVLTDSELFILMGLVDITKKWTQLTNDENFEEKLKQIYDKLDDMEANYG